MTAFIGKRSIEEIDSGKRKCENSVNNDLQLTKKPRKQSTNR